jgi:hypothetical protein
MTVPQLVLAFDLLRVRFGLSGLFQGEEKVSVQEAKGIAHK